MAVAKDGVEGVEEHGFFVPLDVDLEEANAVELIGVEAAGGGNERFQEQVAGQVERIAGMDGGPGGVAAGLAELGFTVGVREGDGMDDDPAAAQGTEPLCTVGKGSKASTVAA